MRFWLRTLLIVTLVLAGFAGSAQAQLRIMPLGDSITDGANVPGGYRINLETYLQWLQLDFAFVGSLTNGPPQLGSRNHEGHSGWRIDQIAANIDRWMDTYRPHVVLLHIGTNDCAQGYQLATMGDRLSRLIDQITDRNPQCVVLVAQITPMSNPTFNQRVVSFNEQIPGIVIEKLLAGRWVIWADMYSAGVALADGVHPNRAGYDTMAGVWFAVFYAVLTGS